MITRDNFHDAIKRISWEDKKKIANALYDFEYCKISISSYGNIWVDELTNDLPSDYEEQVSDGMTYFFQVEDLVKEIQNA